MAMGRATVKRGPDGVWFARPYLGLHAVTRKPMRPYRRFPDARSEEEAQAMADEWMDEVAPASKRRRTRALVDLLEDYVDGVEASGRSPTTAATYRSAVRCYVAPAVGDIDVADLEPYLVETMYGVMLARGSRGGEPLSPNTVRKVHAMMRGAYKRFVRDGLCPSNPFLAVEPPSPEEYEAVAFEPGEYTRLSAALKEAMASVAVDSDSVLMRNVVFGAYAALRTGERCGEVCAQDRVDVNQFTSNWRVGHNMVEAGGRLIRRAKTKGGKGRSISVDEELMEAYRRHVAWQATYLPAPSRRTPLLCLADGRWMRPSKVSSVFSSLRDRLGLPKETHFHTLRHSHATYLLYEGVDVRTIQDRLGHADVATTLRLYAHILPGRDEEAARAFARASRRLEGGSDGSEGGGSS